MTQRDAPGGTLHRRDFLKLSAGSAALLSAGVFAAGLAGCRSAEPPAAGGYQFFRETDLALFTALIPPVLGSALPVSDRTTHITRVLQGMDATGSRLLPPAQAGLRQLFDLLNTGLTRRLTTGVSAPWEQAEPAQVEAFLQRWESSSIGLFNAGYRGLIRFITGAWVSTEAGLQSTGYPGPWQPMFDAVNAS